MDLYSNQKIDLSNVSQVERSAGLDISALPPKNATVSGDIATTRAVKYDFALGDQSPGIDKITSMVQSPGGEDQLREAARSDEMAKRWQAAVDLFKTGEATTSAQTMEDVLAASKRRIGTDSVIEKKFAERALALSLGLTNNPDEVNAGQDQAPQMSQAVYDAHVERLTQTEGFIKLNEDAEAAYQSQNPAHFLDNTATSFIPFYTWIQQAGNSLGQQMSSWLPGSNREEQYAYLRSMGAEDSIALARAIYNEMATQNLGEARAWVQGLVEYSSGGMDDAFGVADVLSITPIGIARKGIAKGLGAAGAKLSTRQALKDARKGVDDFNRVAATRSPEEARKALAGTLEALQSKRVKLLDELVQKQRAGNPLQAAVIKSVLGKVTKDFNGLKDSLAELDKVGAKASAPLIERIRRTAIAASDTHLDLPKMLSATGHVEEAARLQASALAKKMAPQAGKTVLQDIGDLIERTPSLFNPERFLLDAATFSGVRATRIAEALSRNQDLFAQSISGVANVSRIPIDVERAALSAAEASIRDQYRSVKDGLLHAVEKFESKTNPFTNTAFVEAVFGKANGTLFPDAKVALNTGKNRYGLDITDKNIFQEGDGYVIRVRKDIDETAPEVRDALINLDNGSNTTRNKLFGFIPLPKSISSAKDSVSPFQAEQRAIATHATVAEQMFVLRMAEPISRLSKIERKSLDTIMKMNRDAGEGAKRGQFFTSVYQLEEAYVQKFSRLPTENEVSAYQAFVQNSDAQYLYLAGQEIKEKSRKGIERMVLSGKDIPEFAFEGKVVDYVPFNGQHHGSVYYAPNIQSNKGKYLDLNEVRAEDQRTINKLVKDGKFKVIQTNNAEDETLRKSLGVSGPVNFLVVPSVSRGALRFDEQLPYRAGFHVKYKDDYFIKQPKIYRDSTGNLVYGGDTVALGVSNTAKADKEVQLLERARIAIKGKDDNALLAVIADGLPMTVKEIKQIFKTRFDVDTPFGVVKSGQSIADPSVRLGNGKSLQEHVGHFRNYSDSPYNLSKQMTNEFTGHKDGPLYSIKNSGTEQKPVWEMGEARTVDPIDTQIAAMGKLIRSKHYNDYQISAAESFVQEFGVRKGLIHLAGKPVNAEDLRRNPGYYLSQGSIVGVGAEADTARNIQRSIRNLISHKSLLANHISNFQAKALASSYARHGEKYVDTIDNNYAMLQKDLPAKLRGIAFHTKLGLGNPVQILLQSQTLGNIAFISPKHGPSATLVSAWMRRLDLLPGDEAVARSMGEKAAKLTPGWTADEFVESHRLLKKTGFDLIGGDLSWRNDIADPKLFVGKAVKFLDWSAGLFNGTERFVRLSSWNTAYKEYLEKFPKLAGKLTDDEAKTILSRAQDLSGNMTRDAHAFWQEGSASTITQFWGYTARMFDLMTGMRLTAGEKARLVAGWSVMYGVPVGVTAALPIWPWKDEVREMLMAHDTNPDEGLAGLILNGALSTTVAALTGDTYDIGTRYGVGEISVLKPLTDQRYGVDALDALSKIAMGASGSITSDIIKDAYPIIGDLTDAVSGGDTGTLMQDASDLFSNVSTYKQTERALAIFNTGMYATKDDHVIASGKDPWEGLGHLFTGLEKTDAANARAMESVVRTQQSLEGKARNSAKEYIRLYFQSLNEGDSERAKTYIKRARGLMIGGGLTEEQMINAIEAVGKEKTLLDTAKDKYVKSGKTPEEKALRQGAAQ